MDPAAEKCVVVGCDRLQLIVPHFVQYSAEQPATPPEPFAWTRYLQCREHSGIPEKKAVEQFPQRDREMEILGKLNVAKNYAGMALRWNNDRSRREDNGQDPKLDNLQQEHARLALEWIETARQLIIAPGRCPVENGPGNEPQLQCAKPEGHSGRHGCALWEW